MTITFSAQLFCCWRQRLGTCAALRALAPNVVIHIALPPPLRQIASAGSARAAAVVRQVALMHRITAEIPRRFELPRAGVTALTGRANYASSEPAWRRRVGAVAEITPSGSHVTVLVTGDDKVPTGRAGFFARSTNRRAGIVLQAVRRCVCQTLEPILDVRLGTAGPSFELGEAAVRAAHGRHDELRIITVRSFADTVMVAPEIMAHLMSHCLRCVLPDTMEILFHH